MRDTPRGLRLHVGLFGRRNAGKSSLLNRLTDAETSIVSSEPGTTTDPVEKAMEVQPLGPVLFVDTAGLDDEGALGAARVGRSRAVLDRCDLALLVADPDRWDAFEEGLLDELERRAIPTAVVFSHRDRGAPSAALTERLAARRVRSVALALVGRVAVDPVLDALRAIAPDPRLASPPLVSDLVPPGGLVVLVVPIDPEAPKGRLILPQVQTIRDALDHDVVVVVSKERELRAALSFLARRPDLVVTDSQAFLRVAADVPREVPLTSFSILFARLKGDLGTFAAGARAIERLRPGARVLVAEACAHHPTGEDIGTVKIPRWLEQYVGGKLDVHHARGRLPASLEGFDLVVHCGGCVKNRRDVLSRVDACAEVGVPITNYGLCIAYSLGIMDRALEPFGPRDA